MGEKKDKNKISREIPQTQEQELDEKISREIGNTDTSACSVDVGSCEGCQ